MKLTIGRKLSIAFAVSVAILLATGAVSYQNSRELLRTTEAMRASQEMVEVLGTVTAGAQGVEQAARAFLVTRDSAQRRLVAAQAGSVDSDATRLLALVASDSMTLALGTRAANFAKMHTRDWVTAADLSPTVAAAEGSMGRPAAVVRLQAAADSLRDVARLNVQSRAVAARATAVRGSFILWFGMGLVALLAPIAFFIVRREFGERRHAELALAESEQRFRAAADGSFDAFYVLRPVRDAAGLVFDFEFADVNARTESLLGRPREEIVGQRLCELVPANRTSGFVEKYVRVLTTGVPMEEEFEVTTPDVRAAWIHHQVVPLTEGVAVTSRDVTERKRQEEALRALSLVDDLTGLYNRRGFLTLAEQQLKLARRGHRELLLLFVDMDDFKEINDTHGHSEGDVALTRAAAILRKTFRDSDILARLGGDEFVVLATDIAHGTNEVIVDRLRHELRERNERDGYAYRLSFSVGAAYFDPDHPPTIEEFLATADSMLYEQKKHRRENEAPRPTAPQPTPSAVTQEQA